MGGKPAGSTFNREKGPNCWMAQTFSGRFTGLGNSFQGHTYQLFGYTCANSQSEPPIVSLLRKWSALLHYRKFIRILFILDSESVNPIHQHSICPCLCRIWVSYLFLWPFLSLQIVNCLSLLLCTQCRQWFGYS